MVARKYLGVLVSCGAGCAAILYFLIGVPSNGDEIEQGHVSGGPKVSAEAQPTNAGSHVEHEAAVRQQVEPELPNEVATDSTTDIPAALQAERLRLAIETTLVGGIDPGGFLDTALALSALEISKRPIPEPSPFGEIRYPLLGTPEGVSAELRVARSTTATFSGPVLTYHINVATPEEYILEGAARRGLEAQIALWTDKQGNVKHYGVLTDSSVDVRKSRQVGLAWDDRKVRTGAIFTYDAARPYESTATNCGVNDGVPYDSDGQATAIHGHWPRTDDLDRLKSGLLNQYSKL
jgi:hypothetical protein